jgi:hypothetical protein
VRCLWLPFVVGAAGCGAELIEPAQLRFTTGHETEAWTETPTATSVVVERVSARDGTREPLASAAAPLETASLGRGAVGHVEVSGYTDAAERVMFGRSLSLDPSGLAGVSLDVFVARSGSFSRPPGHLQGSAPAALGQIVLGRHLYAFAAQNEQVAVSGYDFGVFRPHAPSATLRCPASPCRFESVAVNGSRVLALGGTWAIWFDLQTGQSGDVALPAGLTSFGEVSGGEAITSNDGDAYIVGATREGTPSTAVLRLDTSGVLQVARLVSPRAGAAAAWLPDRGLLVLGGSSTAGRAELLAKGAGAFIPLAGPPDATVGAALLPSGGRVVRVGGSRDGAPAPTVELALDCADECAELELPVPVPLHEAKGYAIDDEDWLLVGRGPAAETQAVRWRDGGLAEVPLRDRRRGAFSLRAPTGHVLVAGGELMSDGTSATTVELFTP